MTTSVLIIVNAVFDLAAVALLAFVMTRAGRLQCHTPTAQRRGLTLPADLAVSRRARIAGRSHRRR